MKNILVLIVILVATNAFGQTATNKAAGVIIDSNKASENDTSLKVVYAGKLNNTHQAAYFLNDELVSQTLLVTLNPSLIESINVVKSNIQINNVQYYGQIHIKTKNHYYPKLISLTILKGKYTNLKDKSAIFMIDGSIVNADYDSYMVDENYLLTIIVDKVENSKENIDLGLIKILTKSEANIKKSKEIRIRGTEAAMSR